MRDIVNCSECGKSFDLPDIIPMYKYKLISRNSKDNKTKYIFQCSYTCYDHALLRLTKKSKYTTQNYIKYVVDSELMMKSQGKVVIHPIKLPKVGTNND